MGVGGGGIGAHEGGELAADQIRLLVVVIFERATEEFTFPAVPIGQRAGVVGAAAVGGEGGERAGGKFDGPGDGLELDGA